MRKHGLKSAAKRERLLAEAEDEADEAMAEQARAPVAYFGHWPIRSSCMLASLLRVQLALTPGVGWESVAGWQEHCACVELWLPPGPFGLESTKLSQDIGRYHQCMMQEPDLAQDARAVIGELRVDPASLAGRHRARKDKAERMASVLDGREVCTLIFFAIIPLVVLLGSIH